MCHLDLTHLATVTLAQGYPGKIFWGFGVCMPLTPIWSCWKGGEHMVRFPPCQSVCVRHLNLGL